MLLHPPLDDLLKKIDSKYSLVILASKRAHEIDEYKRKHRDEKAEEFPHQAVSPVGIALEEIAEGDLLVNPDSISNDN